MLINKITIGFVVQRFDTDSKKCVDQVFIAGDTVDYEDIEGNLIEPIEDLYHPFDMIQP